MSEKVYIPGNTGLLGSEVSACFKRNNYDVIEVESTKLNLQKSLDTYNFIARVKPDGIVFCAGRVGGIRENQTNSLDMFYENSKIQYSVLEAALRLNIQKLIFISSAAVYPAMKSNCSELDIWKGEPSPEHIQYALAKISGMSFVKNVRDLKKFNWISLIPTNIYGINDNWNKFSGHVIGSLINKIISARDNNEKSVNVWGSGNASREFLYAKDAAEAIFMSYKGLENSSRDRYNLTSGYRATIKEIAEMIKELAGYHGTLIYDSSMPEGPLNRNLSSDWLNSFIDWKPETFIRDGLKICIKHFEKISTKRNSHDSF